MMTIYNATTKKCHVLDAREVASKKAHKEMFRDRYDRAQFGWEAVAVPGELHGLWTAYKTFGGNRSWKSLVCLKGSPFIQAFRWSQQFI
jgi:gamma-glutamyltranspeptidase